MITGTLVAILGALLILVLMQIFKKQPGPQKAPVQDLSNLTIRDAQPGDAVSVAGAGDDFSDLEFTVDRRTRYTSGQRQWYEVSGMYRNRRVALEVYDDDQLEVHAVTNPHRITLDELDVSEEDLAEMDERQNTADSFEYDGKVWMYRLSREASMYRDGAGQAFGFYLWQFQEQGGNRFLSVRKAEGEPFAATVAVRVEPGDISVYRGR